MTKDNNRCLKALHWAMGGNMHEPQANLGANKKFSPDRLKTRKGSLGKN